MMKLNVMVEFTDLFWHLSGRSEKKLQRISGKDTWLPGHELKPGRPQREAVLATQPQ